MKIIYTGDQYVGPILTQLNFLTGFQSTVIVSIEINKPMHK